MEEETAGNCRTLFEGESQEQVTEQNMNGANTTSETGKQQDHGNPTDDLTKTELKTGLKYK